MKTRTILILLWSISLFHSFGQSKEAKYISKKFALEHQYEGDFTTVKNTIAGYEPYRPYLKYVLVGFDAYKLAYWTDIGGEEKWLSGSILVPKEYNETNKNVLMFCHGTIFNQDVPSNWNSPIHIEALPAMGNRITFLPDYLGYGTSSEDVPAYMQKKITVQQLQEFVEYGFMALEKLEVPFSKQMDVVGFSQGGHAALALAESQSESKNSIYDLKNVVSIGGPIDINENLDYILKKQTFASAAYLTYIFGSYGHYYWENNVSGIFNEPYDQLTKDFANGNSTLKMLKDSTTVDIRALMNPKFLEDFLGNKNHWMRKDFASNSITPFETDIPVLLIHGIKDEDVPFATTKKFFNELKKQNEVEKVTFYPLDNLNHIESGFLGIQLALDFLTD
ncbi:alpha/beta fold hydrolase [Flagellimonas nanhaiensis]|uniref:Alpha/beta hydrolase n=1 Tax=Flagellimonas nanhaiensis TaxID=2292706 RepID=A0A371JRK6_9FLAO|nr:alpha/beta hydrolase [Allomuricauda nanhaiensis]RDY60106.1 alpha/beta hydrolase [Allomuricauda nanhaiensis]